MSLRVVAHIRARKGKEKELQSLLTGLTGPTREEKGCIEYRLYQNKHDSQDFTFVEEWEDDAALDAHMETPHVQGALGKAPELLESPPDIRRYRLIS